MEKERDANAEQPAADSRRNGGRNEQGEKILVAV